MIKRNEFTKPQQDEDKNELEFDMDYKDPLILKHMYKNNLYFIIIHL